MTREDLLDTLEDLAEELVAQDMRLFEEVFGSDDPDLDLATLPDEELLSIYEEYGEDES